MPASFTHISKELTHEPFYLQGGEGKLAYIFLPYVALIEMKTLYGVNYKISAVHIKDNYFSPYHSNNGMQRVASYFLKQLEANKNFLTVIEQRWEKDYKQLKETIANIHKKNIQTTPTEELINSLQTIAQQAVNLWNHLIFIDAFDLNGEELLIKELQKTNNNLIKELGTLTYPDELSYSQQEKLSLLNIAKQAYRLKEKIMNINNIPDLPPKIKTFLQAHEKNFYWSKNNYGHIISADQHYFLKELKDALKRTEQEINDEITRIITTFNNQNKRRKQLLTTLPENTLSLINFFQKISVLRDKRKAMSVLALTEMKQLSSAIEHKLNLEEGILDNALFTEYPQLKKSKEYLKELQQRKQEVMLINSDASGISVFTGKQARDLKNIIDEQYQTASKELKGCSASKGKVIGTVKIINKVEEFKKFNRGDILVSAMTRPEFLPLMEKAAAIITDEGGITSHASIVSRELGIPCIVRTLHATRILKDGDRVEVNADKGTVRKL